MGVINIKKYMSVLHFDIDIYWRVCIVAITADCKSVTQETPWVRLQLLQLGTIVQSVRTPPFHGGNISSNLVGVIVFFIQHLGHKHECHRAETHSTQIVESENYMLGIPFM